MTDLTDPHITMHVHRQHCSRCHQDHRYSHLYFVETKGNSKKLSPVRTVMDAMGLPRTVQLMPITEVPFCFICEGTLPTTDAEAHRRWAETIARKRGEAATPVTAPHAYPVQRTGSIDDLE